MTALNGSGKIPSGYSLLIYDREVGPNNQASSSAYYSLDGPVTPSGDSWSLAPMYFGPRTKVSNFYIEISGVLVTNATARFINAEVAAPLKNGNLVRPNPSISAVLLFPALPPGAETINAFLSRNNDLTQCASGG
jgi:hypothetical protein